MQQVKMYKKDVLETSVKIVARDNNEALLKAQTLTQVQLNSLVWSQNPGLTEVAVVDDDLEECTYIVTIQKTIRSEQIVKAPNVATAEVMKDDYSWTGDMECGNGVIVVDVSESLK